ncbi:DUF4249 domain-containing protein [Reichenbachiella ulvae]|uniref:DUF4249 domain-containing protein n=1 Tax=Reichenbachiella ulvae TaxID=2980104 RepID=A0ABT3CNE4_9BACT|nr:DUF4249 domain-containing protein [Reichenbachiella ulvae]MCV9385043.1 DUF4249 domain-containing protein [Reichenbachiella ulvae]
MKRILHISILIAGIYACVEPYDFEVKDTEEVMVVDVSLTNEVKTQEVRLFQSYPLDGTEGTPLTGAVISVQEVEGQEYPFIETSDPGVYQSVEQFGGSPGLSYVLKITTIDGQEFESLPEKMPEPVAIDSIYGRYIERPSSDDDRNLKGVQFMVDNHNDNEAFSSYRFEYKEDFSINVTYPSMYEYLEAEDSLIYRRPSIATCYNSRESTDFLTETTSGQSKNRLSEFPIVYVEDNEPQLRFNYSLTVRQLSISPGAYQYYKSLKENNESSGSFFDKQKGTVLGNISNVSDQAFPVLGYFEVAAVSTGFRYFPAGSFRSQGFVPSRYSFCDYNEYADTVAVDSLIFYDGLGYSKNVFTYTDPSLTSVAVVPSSCSDCRNYGVLEKPDFWE